MLERRRSQRFQPEEEIYARIKSSIPVRIVDVSRHGMQVESTSALPPSGECDIWLPSDDGDVKLRIRVQRCRARFVQKRDGFKGLMYQAGLEFLEMNDVARSALTCIVQALGDDASAHEDVSMRIDRDSNDDSQEQQHNAKAV
jgi:hypothetical protein